MKRILAPLAVLVLLLAACGDDDKTDTADSSSDGASSPEYSDSGSGSGASSSAAADDAAVTAKGFAFTVNSEVKAGEPFTVANEDSTAHTFTLDDDPDSRTDISGGSTGEVTIDDAGEYTFHCDIHSSMTGTITVT